ncbi:nucleotide disphospho-sugar-binding domain-containing protein [Microbacterium sp. NPDC096154]|uniref:glycosyltransferase n=1 Tax=Microbacterium sp. NPDC096154 TaxID=3155549 RepID=UPI0033208A80
MKYAFALPGSRGDVQPALSVALELRRRGHDVAVGVAPDLLDLAARLGLDPRPIGRPTGDLLSSEAFRLHQSAADPRIRYRALQDVAAYGWDELRRDVAALAADADTIVTGLLGQEIGSAVAERQGAAFAALHYCPVRANDAAPLIPGVRARSVQRAAWRAGERLRWALTRRAENAQREALGLTPAVVDLPQRLRDRGALEIQVYDPLLVPGLPAGWGAHRPFTGFLDFRADDRALLAEPGVGDELGRWIDDGEPPVYIGFGSMPVDDPERLLSAIEHATADLGVRALLSGGWAPRDSAAHVKRIGAADHSAVFPRCVAAVHHGGAGTVGAALRAGIPSLVAWISADQPMWGELLRRAGAGASVKAAGLDRRRLREALARVLGAEVRERAARIRDRMTPAGVAVAETARLVEQAR